MANCRLAICIAHRGVLKQNVRAAGLDELEGILGGWLCREAVQGLTCLDGVQGFLDINTIQVYGRAMAAGGDSRDGESNPVFFF